MFCVWVCSKENMLKKFYVAKLEFLRILLQLSICFFECYIIAID